MGVVGVAGEASWSGGVVWIGVGSGEWGVPDNLALPEELTCWGLGEKLENWRVAVLARMKDGVNVGFHLSV